jgi:hypothetical protein
VGWLHPLPHHPYKVLLSTGFYARLKFAPASSYLYTLGRALSVVNG